MPDSFKPNFSNLSEKEKEVALSVIEGSNLLYWEFVASLSGDPKDLAYVERLRDQVQTKADTLSSQVHINLQKEQKPKFLVIGCIDSRVHASTILFPKLGNALVNRAVACGIEDNGKISEQIAGTVAMAVDVMGVSTIVLMPHGRCGGISKAWQSCHMDRPKEAGAGRVWDMLQKKHGVFEEIESKGPDYFINRLEGHLIHENEDDRFLHAAEICSALRDLRLVKKFVKDELGAADKVEVISIFVGLRTLNARLLLITGPGEDDWEIRSLTNHAPIPQKGLESIDTAC